METWEENEQVFRRTNQLIYIKHLLIMKETQFSQ